MTTDIDTAARLLRTTKSHVCLCARTGELLRGKYKVERTDEGVTITDAWGRPVQLSEPETTVAEEALRVIAAGKCEDAQAFAREMCRRMHVAPF